MNHSDIALLMKGAAPAIRDYVASAMQPLVERIGQLEQQLADAEAVDHSAMIKAAVDAAFAAMPKPVDGKDADMAEVGRMVSEAVARLPPAKDGKDADPETMRGMVADAIASLPKPADGKDADPAEIARMVSEAVNALPPAAPGKDADPEMVRAMVTEAVAALPPAEPGKDADMAELERMVAERVESAASSIEPREPDAEVLRELIASEVAKLPPAEPGRDAVPPSADELRALIAPLVTEAVDALPKPQDGKSITAEDVAPLIADEVSKAVAALPVPKDGAPGKLPVAKAWDGEVTYEAEVRTHKGALWQAVRDTGREPGLEDWICLAAAGAPGRDADQIEIAGTYDPGKAGAYRRLSIVALNGGAFIAKKDEPGECPGEGWQVIAMRGKAGQPGQSVKGDPGRGTKGDPGDPVVAMSVDDQGMLTLVNGDGSTVECDLYPVLAKVQG